MSQKTFDGIGIKAIAACVPPRIVKTAEQTKYFSNEQLAGFIATTGIDERRITDNGVTSSCRKTIRESRRRRKRKNQLSPVCKSNTRL